MTPDQGIIEPQSTITLNIGFQPISAKNYELKLPLYFQNENTPHTEISILG